MSEAGKGEEAHEEEEGEESAEEAAQVVCVHRRGYREDGGVFVAASK